MGVDTTLNYSLATDDEEYPQGFSDEPEDEEPDNGDYWFDEDEDYYDFPENWSEDDEPA